MLLKAYYAIFCQWTHKYRFLHFCIRFFHIRWMNRHPVSGQTFFLMGFHAILRQILNYCFDAITLRKLYVCATFYAFSNCAACTTFETIYVLRQKEKWKAMKAWNLNSWKIRDRFFQIRCKIWHEKRYVDRKKLLNSSSLQNIFGVVGMCVKNLPQNISSIFPGQGSTIFLQSGAGLVRFPNPLAPGHPDTSVGEPD